jgi:hypothetical protein
MKCGTEARQKMDASREVLVKDRAKVMRLLLGHPPGILVKEFSRLLLSFGSHLKALRSMNLPPALENIKNLSARHDHD